MIAIEGMQGGNPFLRYTHIEERRGVFIFDWNYRVERPQKGPTWLRARFTVVSMLESINKDIKNQREGNPISFNLQGGKESVLTTIFNLGITFATGGLWTVGNLIFRGKTGLLGMDNPSVNCIEWAKEKLSYAGIDARNRINIVFSSPDDYIDPSMWQQSANSLSSPVVITIQVRYQAQNTLSLAFNISNAIQDQIGPHEWYPVGLLDEHKIWEYGRNFQVTIGHQIVYSILVRGEKTPRFIDVTNSVRDAFPEAMESADRNSRRLDSQHIRFDGFN
jgi:hypothetical protein